MGFKTIVSTKKFWPSVMIFTAAFIVIFNLIRIGVEYSFDFNAYFSFYFKSSNWISFIIANLIGGFIYGFAMVYARYWRQLKEQNRR